MLLLFFTWLAIPPPVSQPETTKCWPVSPSFTQSALQTKRQHDFFPPPSLHEEPEAHFHEAKQILQQLPIPGFILLKLFCSDRTISEKLGKKKWRRWDHIFFSPLFFSSKGTQYENSDLVWIAFREDCDFGYLDHRFGYRYIKILYEAWEFQEHRLT